MTDALAAGPIQVRIGVHTGTPLIAEEGYVGGDVHRCGSYRRCRTRRPGCSLQCRLGQLAGLEVSDLLASTRLKDIAEPISIYQLGDGRFPPLNTLSSTNLPSPSQLIRGS